MSLAQKIFILLGILLSSAVSAAPVDLGPVAQQIQELFKTKDVVVLGEIHHIHEQRALLTALASASAPFTAIATEAVWKIDQPVLDRFISNGDEKEFFIEEGWLNSINIREAFRKIRAASIDVCAVDIDFYGPNKMKERRVELRERFKAMPKEVLILLQKQNGKTAEQLIKAGDPIERDYLMAVEIDACLKKHRKVLVHLGQYHATSQDPVYQKQTKGSPWDTMQWLAYLNSSASFSVVYNMMNTPEDLDAAGKALVAHYKASGRKAPFLLSSTELPAKIKKLMTEDGQEHWRRSDYVIVGPLGTLEKKVKN